MNTTYFPHYNTQVLTTNQFPLDPPICSHISAHVCIFAGLSIVRHVVELMFFPSFLCWHFWREIALKFHLRQHASDFSNVKLEFHRLRPFEFYVRYIEETMRLLIYYSNEGCVAKISFPFLDKSKI